MLVRHSLGTKELILHSFFRSILLKVCLQQRTWVKAALRVFIGVNLPPIGWLSEHEPGPDCVRSEACSQKLRGLDWLHRLKQPVLGYRTGIDWLNRIKTWSARSALMTDNLFLEALGTLFLHSQFTLNWSDFLLLQSICLGTVSLETPNLLTTPFSVSNW